MAMDTLLQSAVLSQDMLLKGILEEMVQESELLRLLPFTTVTGNSLAYVREDESNLGSVSFRPVGGLWPESTAQFLTVSASLKVLGEDADVDKFILKTRSNLHDQMAVQVAIKSKLMARKYEEQAVYGDSTNSFGFDGMHRVVAAGRTLRMAENAIGAPLTTYTLDHAIDLCEKGKPAFILMNKAVRRRLTVSPHGDHTRPSGMIWQDVEVWGWDSHRSDGPAAQTELCDARGTMPLLREGRPAGLLGDGRGGRGLDGPSEWGDHHGSLRSWNRRMPRGRGWVVLRVGPVLHQALVSATSPMRISRNKRIARGSAPSGVEEVRDGICRHRPAGGAGRVGKRKVTLATVAQVGTPSGIALAGTGRCERRYPGEYVAGEDGEVGTITLYLLAIVQGFTGGTAEPSST